MKTADYVDDQMILDALETLKNGYIIVGKDDNRVYGTLDFITLFVWTTREKAENFIKENCDSNEQYSIIEEPILQIGAKAQRKGFFKIRFDFIGKNADPKQQYLNLPIFELTNYVD